MADLVERQAVKEWLAKWIGYIDEDTVARMQIRTIDIPSARQEQQWIPCSERLPEPESKEQRRGFYFTTNGYGSVGMTRYEFYDDFRKTGWQGDIRIDAWMPLPEPWKGES